MAEHRIFMRSLGYELPPKVYLQTNLTVQFADEIPTDDPGFSEALIDDLLEADAVYFCGAGVSGLRLANFRNLAVNVYKRRPPLKIEPLLPRCALSFAAAIGHADDALQSGRSAPFAAASLLRLRSAIWLRTENTKIINERLSFKLVRAPIN